MLAYVSLTLKRNKTLVLSSRGICPLLTMSYIGMKTEGDTGMKLGETLF